MKFKVDQKVRATKTLGDAPNDHNPGGVYAERGELLVVRKISTGDRAYPIHVSHEHITDSAFCVAENEIEAA